MIILEGVRVLRRSMVSKTIRRYDVVGLPISAICFADDRRVSCIHLNTTIAGQEI